MTPYGAVRRVLLGYVAACVAGAALWEWVRRRQ